MIKTLFLFLILFVFNSAVNAAEMYQFGENIRALANKGNFQKGQYQIYFINGCDTFFYVDDLLRKAHEIVNPGSKPYEFFDIVTNALPSSFNGQPPGNLDFMRAFVEQKATYSQILSKMDPQQVAIVTGEEDNTFKPTSGD